MKNEEKVTGDRISRSSNNSNSSKNNSRIVPVPAAAAVNDDDDGGGDDESLQKAARAVKESDILVLVTGAGFSADSGLAVYDDIGKIDTYQAMGLDYSDISQPKWIEEDPGLFYGFWGQCFNDYRTTNPHDGYQILRGWKDEKNNTEKRILSSSSSSSTISVAKEIRSRIKNKYRLRRPFDDDETVDMTPYLVDHNRDDGEDGDPTSKSIAGAFYAFTSNVDGHHYDVFEACEINECHGNIELWQCTDRYNCDSGMWRAPVNHSFVVDKDKMYAPEFVNKPNDSTKANTAVGDDDDINKDAERRQQSTPIDDDDDRPARLGSVKTKTGKRSNLLQNLPPGLDQKGWAVSESDFGTESIVGNWPRCGHCGSLARPSILMFGDVGCKGDMAQQKRWELWREAVLNLTKASTEKLKICIVEIGCGLNVQTGRETTEKMLEDVLKRDGNVTLVRINPDSPEGTKDSVAEDFTIPVRLKGLEAIRRIDKINKTTR